MLNRVALTALTALTAAVLAGCTETSAPPDALEPSGISSTPSAGTTPGPAASVEDDPRASAALCFNRRATITGTPDADRLVGTRARDVIVTFGGDDTVDNLGGDDWVCTGAGDDIVRADRIRDIPGIRGVDLGAGDDRLRFFEATDIDGGPGDDRIVVDQGVGSIDGGPGDDYLRSLAVKVPYGYADNTPCLSYSGASHGVRINLERGTAHGEGDDTVVNFRCAYGSHFNDTIIGSARTDYLELRGGDDLVFAGRGNDSVAAGAGDDRVYLGEGDDSANGESGRDRLYGQDGSDYLEGWSDADYLDGGDDNDQVYGAFFCELSGNSYGNGGLIDTDGDEVFGGAGEDYVFGDLGNDRLDGGPGIDRGQGGYHDGRVDWISSVEIILDGCPTYEELTALGHR